MDKKLHRVSTDYNPDEPLQVALTKYGIDRFGLLPFKAGTIIEIGKVTAHTALTAEVIFQR